MPAAKGSARTPLGPKWYFQPVMQHHVIRKLATCILHAWRKSLFLIGYTYSHTFMNIVKLYVQWFSTELYKFFSSSNWFVYKNLNEKLWSGLQHDCFWKPKYQYGSSSSMAKWSLCKVRQWGAKVHERWTAQFIILIEGSGSCKSVTGEGEVMSKKSWNASKINNAYDSSPVGHSG